MASKPQRIHIVPRVLSVVGWTCIIGLMVYAGVRVLLDAV